MVASVPGEGCVCHTFMNQGAGERMTSEEAVENEGLKAWK